MRVPRAAHSLRPAGEYHAVGREARAALDYTGHGGEPSAEIRRIESAAERVHVVPGDQGLVGESGIAHGSADAATTAATAHDGQCTNDELSGADGWQCADGRTGWRSRPRRSECHEPEYGQFLDFKRIIVFEPRIKQWSITKSLSIVVSFRGESQTMFKSASAAILFICSDIDRVLALIKVKSA